MTAPEAASLASAFGSAGHIGWWRCLAVDARRRPQWVAVVWSRRHPGLHRVELLAEAAAREIGSDAVCTAHFDEDGRVQRLVVGERAAPAAPPLWFVEVRETAAHPPATSLVAFTGAGVEPGTLLDAADLGRYGVGSADQVGALRWWPATGEVDQIYVQPAWRRRGVASALIAAGATFASALDWARLWSDGQRTEMGEALRNASPWADRALPLTHVAPPMTPPTPPG